MDVETSCTLGDLVRLLQERHDDAFRAMIGHKSMQFFVSDVHAEPAQPLSDGDDVAILAPVAGGARADGPCRLSL